MICFTWPDGTSGSYQVSLIYQPNDTYQFQMWDILSAEQNLLSLQEDIRYYQLLLQLCDRLMFRYDCTDNSYWLYWVRCDQHITIFKGDLDVWISSITEKGCLTTPHDSGFDAFISALKSHISPLEFQFQSCIVTQGKKMLPTRVIAESFLYHGRKVFAGVFETVASTSNVQSDTGYSESFIDPLTGMLNKKAIIEFAQTSLAASENGPLCFVLLDIDNFKSINDRYGHLFGDEVIKAIAKIIIESVETSGICGKFGGDEFFLILDKPHTEQELRTVLRTIQSNVRMLYQDTPNVDMITCSIGISRYPQNAGDFKTLFLIADKALYIAKQRGKNRYIIYSEEKHGSFQVPEEATLIDVQTTPDADVALQHLSDSFVGLFKKGKSALPDCLKNVLTCFRLDRADVFVGKDLQHLFHISDTIKKSADPAVLQVSDFKTLFTEDHTFADNNINELEYRIPDAHSLLSKSGTTATFMYYVENEKGPVIFISFDRCDGKYTWSKMYLMNLKILCQVLETILVQE
ncbi:MAG: GGDEF domain-containing protein [Lachnospiraceae bacterium]|nr:GGDEF domain-containing protein [Lachnospiraceae bacterium]